MASDPIPDDQIDNNADHGASNKPALKAAVRNAYHISYQTNQHRHEPPQKKASVKSIDNPQAHFQPKASFSDKNHIQRSQTHKAAANDLRTNGYEADKKRGEAEELDRHNQSDAYFQKRPSEEVNLKEPLTLKLYGVLTGLSGRFVQRVLNRRLAKGKEDALRLHERRGVGTINRPEGSLIWIHGASVGESLSVLPLVEDLVSIRPDLNFLITTGTTTSASLMVDRLPKNAFHQFIPVDYPPYVNKFLDHWKPDVAIFVESEFWPNLIKQTRKNVAMMAIVNGRISPKSYRNWKKRPRSIRYLLSAFDLIIAQDHDNAARLRDLSSRDVMLFGNLKNAASPLPANSHAEDMLRKQMGDRPRWLAASTHPNEEEMIFDAHCILRDEFPTILTTIAPRHPERGDYIAQIAASYNLRTAQRSKGDDINADVDIYIADTLGELGSFYRINDIALVGGGLTPKGGHNPLEPARLENAILHGPHIFNFNETYNEMRRAGAAALVRNDRDIAAAVKRLLSDDKTRYALARLAGKTAHENAERILRDINSQLMEGINIACPLNEASVPKTTIESDGQGLSQTLNSREGDPQQ